MSLPASDALPADLQDWIRREWLIENQVHPVRDVTFREDLHQARTGTGPAVIATLRNTAIGWHRTNGDTNIARALGRSNRRPCDLITAVTSSYATNAMTLIPVQVRQPDQAGARPAMSGAGSPDTGHF